MTTPDPSPSAAPAALPAALRLGPVTLAVADLARSVDFYTGVLGLAVVAQAGEAASLGAGGVPLLHLRAQAGLRPQPRFSTGLYHVAILLPTRLDLGRVLINLARTRYPLQGFADHLVSEAIYLADPDGNGLELYRDRPRTEWRWRGSQIVMASDPLDVDGIAAEVPDPQAPFTGMPAGTVIGHVHLKVGDVRQGEAFYHGVIGFGVVARLPGALFVSAGGYHHHLGANSWESRGAPRPPADAAGLREFTIVLPDEPALDQLGQRLRAADHAAEQPGTALLVDDPWGNRIRIRAEAA